MALQRLNASLHDLKREITKYPQVMINVRLSAPFKPDGAPRVKAAVHEAEAELATRGRVLLRPSGTEPVVRVMVEGQDAAQVERLARQLADVVKSEAAGAQREAS
jgi:phosphoglucosamine mutase